MILVDTSVWVDHLRGGNDMLSARLLRGEVLGHPFVIGEILLGGPNPDLIANLQALPVAARASDAEVQHVIQRRKLAGRGIGLVDAHLLASLLLTPGARLWTLDESLRAVAADMSLAA